MASIRDLPPLDNGTKRYQVRWTEPLTGDQRTKVFRAKTPAKEFKAQVEHEINTGEYRDDRAGKITVAEMAQIWLDGKTVDPSALDDYETKIRLYIIPGIGSMRLQDVRPSDVRRFLSGVVGWRGQPLSTAVMKKVVGHLRSIFELALEDRRVRSNPVTKTIRAPKREAPSDEPKRTLTPDEFHVLADAMATVRQGRGERYRAAILVMGYGGLRRGEIAGLQRRDYNHKTRELTIRRQVSVTKDGHLRLKGAKKFKVRTIPLPDGAAIPLRDHLLGVPNDRDAQIFTAPKGGLLSPNAFQRRYFDLAVKASGLEGRITPHALRHSCASYLIKRGVPITVVSEYLGHASPDITLKIYAHMFPNDLRLAAEAMNGDRSETG